MIKYQAKFFKDGKRYSVIFPDLPGCFSQGITLEEAKKNAVEALSLYLEEARDPHWQVPKPKKRKGSQYYWIIPDEDIAIPLMIRQARVQAGYSQQQLAQAMGIKAQQLQKLETPRKANPTIKTLIHLSKVLHGELLIKIAA